MEILYEYEYFFWKISVVDLVLVAFSDSYKQERGPEGTYT